MYALGACISKPLTLAVSSSQRNKTSRDSIINNNALSLRYFPRVVQISGCNRNQIKRSENVGAFAAVKRVARGAVVQASLRNIDW